MNMKLRIYISKFYQQNKTPLLFLARAFGFYLIWIFVYHGILVEIDIDDPLTEIVSKSSTKLLNEFDEKISLRYLKGEFYIYREEINLIHIGDACNGLELYVLFISFYFALGKAWQSIKWILAGIAGIFILNILRISGLAMMVLYRPTEIEFHHKYTFTLVVYSWILLIWIFSLKKERAK